MPIVLLFGATTSCVKKETATHSTAWNSTGSDSIVKVDTYDSNGNFMTYFMAYAVFRSLYSSGGYNAVNNYYYQNRASIDRNYDGYSKSYNNTSNPLKKLNTKNSSNSSSGIYRSSSPSHISSSSSNNSYRSSSPSYKSSSSSSSSSYRSSSPSYRSSSSSSSSFRSSSPSFRSSSPVRAGR